MRVAFVVPSLRPSGGVRIAVQHARLLRERAQIDAALVVCDDEKGAAEGGDVPSLGPAQAVAEPWDVAVATWWTTWPTATELDARRRALLVQGVDERFYATAEPFERLGASMALASADELIAVSGHLRDVVTAARPGAHCHLVRNGLDPAGFAAAGAPSNTGPLRILVEGQPDLPLKGVGDALVAVGEMRERTEVTLASLEPPASRDFRAHRVVSGLDAREMAELYASSDVLLKLSRSEGLGLPPLEAAAAGTPSVVTPYGGHEDWLRHGVNGVLVGFDDPSGTAGWLDALARDRDLLARLGAGARETAQAWPSVEDASDEMAHALRSIADGEGADPAEVARASARALRRGMGTGRLQHDAVVVALAWSEAAADARLQEVLDSRAYKLSEAMRRAWWRLSRRRPL
jgi:glycosyltransferase involved in cell wall biosynthesis